MSQTALTSPLDIYQHALSNEGFMTDPIQAAAVQLTQHLYHQLSNLEQTSSLLSKFKQHKFFKRLYSSKKNNIQGLYFWGGVGRGKTWLVDSFFNSLPIEAKRRVHFHEFMLEIHAQLAVMPKTPDPIPLIAQRLAEDYRVICLDEFHVNDITDAMILAGLLKALFEAGVVLVSTSNIPPDELYKNGLQRARFLPAIEWIKEHTTVFHLDNDTDYRHLVLEKEGCYHSPLNAHAEDMLLQHFIELSDHGLVKAQTIEINKREVKVEAVCESVVWLDFDELCNTARSTPDYYFLADNYDHIILANIYAMDEDKNDVAKRFMHLVDIIYDKRRCLIMSAAGEPKELYTGKRLIEPFQRTISRLNEMRSSQYKLEHCQ